MWYKNLCSLRYHRCIYDIVDLQRDREKISCELRIFIANLWWSCCFFLFCEGIGVPKPDFNATPPPSPSPPTVVPLPTLSPQLCADDHEWYKSIGVIPFTRCRNDGKHRPVQCWTHPEIPGALRCGCYILSLGSLSDGSEWTVDCATEPSPL